jgi:hypothetical protein
MVRDNFAEMKFGSARALLARAAIALLAVAGLACSVAPFVAPPPATFVPAPTAPALTPTGTPRATSPSQKPPAWWAVDLPMPKGAEFVGDSTRALWRTPDSNVVGLRDYFIRQATGAGYKSYVVTLSGGSIYDLFFTKRGIGYSVNLTQGSDATFITGDRVGIFHLRVAGVTHMELDLPMRARLDVTPGSEISIGTSIPNSECPQCEYYVNVHIAPFKGVGAYDSRPGAYLIDIQVIPGGTPDKDDYRWAQSCAVIVKDANSGSFECSGLQNVADQSRRIDVSGSWQQP